LHTINAVLVCLVAFRISRRHAVTFLTGAMFACHPFAMEPVAWVSGRMVLIATTFALLTILIGLHRRSDGRGRGPWLAGLAWCLSLLSKVMPSVPIAAAWCDIGQNGRLSRRTWFVYAVLTAMGLGAGMLALKATDTAGFRQAAEAEATTSRPVRLLLATGYYLENYVWPNRLSAWSPPPDRVTIASNAALRALVVSAAFVGLVLISRKYAHPVYLALVLFAILLAPFLIASLSRRMLAADRYMYLPMLGLNLAVATTIVQVSDWLRKRRSAVIARGGMAVAAAAVLVTWFWIGRGLAPTWADTINRDQRVLAIYPDHVLAHCELARAYVFSGAPDRALEIVEQARARWPEHPRLAAQAGEAYRLKGDWRRAEAELAFAAARMPMHVRTLYYYALTLEQLDRREEARRLYGMILDQNTGFLPAATALARSYTASGEIGAAMAAWEAALKSNPYHRNSLYELALLKIRRNNLPEAEHLLRRAVKLDPADRPVRFHLAVVLFNSGRRVEAVELYRRLLSEDETDVVVRLNLANALATLNPDDPAAEREYRRILRQRPDSLLAALGLHELLYPGRRIDASSILELWTEYHRAAGQTAESSAYLAWAQVLNDRMMEAKTTASSIPVDSPYRAFSDWAFVYDTLRRQAWDELVERLDNLEINWTVLHSDIRQQQARVIRPALLELPETIRQSVAGRYVLARFFLFEQDWDRARLTAEQIVGEAESNRWTAAARELLKELNKHDFKAE
ncbi:MAG: tetratricopeptide repeat protein, partial [Phycisphaerae bacterium]